jgi:type III restriction enzyme
MNRHVNNISGRLSLRPPQQNSLVILDRVCEILLNQKDLDRSAQLIAIQNEYPTVTDFEREFPSLCFSLATGVGKTRLMGAFITYLHLAKGISNFFILAPNLTIYNKLITDFTPNTPKYVFKGISEFSLNTPELITGDNYENRGNLLNSLISCKINIFNISKINSEVRGGKEPRIKRLSEYLGESYFDFLANLDDLVILMDESHRYRASAGIRAINELKPILGLELTATPFIENSKGAIPFKNIIFDYPLRRAMEDGFVKEPAVVTRQDFNPAGMSPEEIERIKLEDGIRLHESIKVELETYARNTNVKIVKPFVLVIARDITHASQIVELIQSDHFFGGRYRDKIIQVDSSKKEDETIERLLKVESTSEPTEIVVHVNMLKEGWDVTNLYTIVPLRAANARILIEQSIGRGLRLPYGKRTGVEIVDRLNIIAHDKFQEIIDEANRPDSQIQMKQIILAPELIEQKTISVVSKSILETCLEPELIDLIPINSDSVTPKPFPSPTAQRIAEITYQVIRKLETQPNTVPTSAHLQLPEIQALVKEEVIQKMPPAQQELAGVIDSPDISAIIHQATDLFIQQTIDIPRIYVFPIGEVRSGFHPFTLELSVFNYSPSSENLWGQDLRTGEGRVLKAGTGKIKGKEDRLEDHIVYELADFNDISYEEHNGLLYDLAGQTVRHFLNYLSEEDTLSVIQANKREIAKFIRTQMQQHFWEETGELEVRVSRGFTKLKRSAYAISVNELPLNFRQAPTDKSNMAKYLFGGFSRCLYRLQKFQSDAERLMAIILDRESTKWFKSANGQFQLYYRWDGEHREYQPDFVAETPDAIYMLEPKASNQMDAEDVLAKKDAAIQWCQEASKYNKEHGGKPWSYLLIPHDVIAENATLLRLVELYKVG